MTARMTDAEFEIASRWVASDGGTGIAFVAEAKRARESEAVLLRTLAMVLGQYEGLKQRALGVNDGNKDPTAREARAAIAAAESK
jgi:hypothetical protein